MATKTQTRKRATARAKQPAPEAQAAKKPRALDHEALRGAVRLIEEHGQFNHAGTREALERRYKLKLTFTTGTYTASMLGVRASATPGERHALDNWAKAARRALLKAGAA